MQATWKQHAAEVRAALMGLYFQPEADKAIAALDAMCAQYDGCHAELLAIHEIASCGWANVLQHPIAPEDTLTVRDVKLMAVELMKDRPTPETPNVVVQGQSEAALRPVPLERPVGREEE